MDEQARGWDYSNMINFGTQYTKIYFHEARIINFTIFKHLEKKKILLIVYKLKKIPAAGCRK